MRRTVRTKIAVAFMMAVASFGFKPRAHAQAHPAAATHPTELFAVNYSAQHALVAGSGGGFWLQGISGEGTVPLGKEISLAGTGMFFHARSSNAATTPLDELVFAGGPRYGHAGPPFFHSSHLFLQAMLGAAHGYNGLFPQGTSTRTSANSLAILAGGGLDIFVSRRVAIRVIEADYLRTALPNGSANVQNDPRLSAGVVFSVFKGR
jgi:peptidoglycan-associated lipoprotein